MSKMPKYLRQYFRDNHLPMPPKARPREVKKGARIGPQASVAPMEPPGTVIARFFVSGRPVPWKAPTVNGPPTIGYQEFKGWQNDVAARAMVCYGLGRPYAGTVELDFRFVFDSFMDKRRHGDITNLIKSTEDALQDIVIVNDRQVRRTCGTIEDGAQNGVRIIVRAMDPIAYAGEQ